jgi:hypothetical protein
VRKNIEKWLGKRLTISLNKAYELFFGMFLIRCTKDKFVPYLVKARGPDMSASDVLDHPYSKSSAMFSGFKQRRARQFVKVNKKHPLI